jgi:hypothetical protein
VSLTLLPTHPAICWASHIPSRFPVRLELELSLNINRTSWEQESVTGKVLLEMSMSLDGYVVGPQVSPESPLGIGGERLHEWMFVGRSAAESREFETNHFSGIGALILGRRMADLGIGPWGDEPRTRPFLRAIGAAHGCRRAGWGDGQSEECGTPDHCAVVSCQALDEQLFGLVLREA